MDDDVEPELGDLMPDLDVDAIVGLLGLTLLSPPPPPLDGAPPAGAADAAARQRARDLAALADGDDDAPLPLVLDARDLPDGVRRRAGDAFDMDALLRAAEQRRQQQQQQQPAGSPPPPEGNVAPPTGAASELNREEAHRLLALLSDKLQPARAFGSDSHDDSAAAFARVLAATMAAGGADTDPPHEAGRKRVRDERAIARD